MTNRRPALVAGAGPAGLSAAIGLLRRGFDVTVLEQRAQWQDRVCGAFLNPEAVEHLRWLGTLEAVRKEAVAVERTDVTAHFGGSTQVSTEQKGRAALALPRRRLEEILLRRVREEGGRIEMGTRFKSEGETPRQLLVMAGGRFATGRPPDGSGWYGWNAAFSNAEQKPGEMSLHFYPGGYVGVVTFADGVSNVCGLVKKQAATNLVWETVFEEAKEKQPALRRQLATAARASAWRGVGPLPFSKTMNEADGFLLAGDAAAVGDPFMGEGNGRALGAGPMIAEAVSNAGGAAAEPARVIAAYNALWNAHYSSRLKLGFWTRRALGSSILLPAFGRFIMQNPRFIRWATPHFHVGYRPIFSLGE